MLLNAQKRTNRQGISTLARQGTLILFFLGIYTLLLTQFLKDSRADTDAHHGVHSLDKLSSNNNDRPTIIARRNEFEPHTAQWQNAGSDRFDSVGPNNRAHFNDHLSQKQLGLEDDVLKANENIEEGVVSLGVSDKPEKKITLESTIEETGEKVSERTKRQYSTPKTNECEEHTGLQLLDIWKSKKQVWCDGTEAKLVCYPHWQPHGRKRNRLDVFCEATNFFIDFRKIKRGPTVQRDSYLQFEPGATFANCVRTPLYQDSSFMNHQRRQLGGNRFASISEEEPAKEDYDVESEMHYLFARDEDCLNTYHATTDYSPAFIVGQILGLDWKQTQVVIWDSMPESKYEYQIKRAFSPNSQKLKRLEDFPKKIVKFKRLIFHLESPASIFYASFERGVTHCSNSELWEAFRLFMLDAFNLRNIPQPRMPAVTIVTRDPRSNRRVPRRFRDLDSIAKIARGMAPFGQTFRILSLDQTDIETQMKVFRETTILIGIHGAGLVNTLYLADEAVLLEIHPGTRVDYYFRTIARMLGTAYVPMRTLTTCNSQVTEETDIDLEEFRRAMDAALRIARQFNGGSAECGLDCLKSFAATTDPFFNGEYGKTPEATGAQTKSKEQYIRDWRAIDTALSRC